jgi:hypothetical protein
MKKTFIRTCAFLTAAAPVAVMAVPDEAQTAIVASGATIAALAATAGAAGVAIMVTIYGIRTAARALKAPK